MPSATDPRTHGGRSCSARVHAWHLAALMLVLLAVETPRFAAPFASAAAPVFSPAQGYLDFDQAYYPAAQSIRHAPAEIYRGASYDARTGALEIRAPAHFVNIPVVAWLFVPLTVLPLAQAGTLLLALNAVIALACLLLQQRRVAGCGGLWQWALTLAFLTSGPLLNALNLGQTTPLVLLLLLLGEERLRRGQDVRAGAWLGLACLIKIPPLIFLPYFALRRRWRLLASAIAVVLVAVGVSVACYGWPLHRTYLDLTIRANAGTASAAYNSQSVDSVLARLSTGTRIWSWQPVVLGSAVRTAKWLTLGALLAVAVLSLLTAGLRADDLRMRLEMGMVMCLSLVALPVSWVHYGTWLLPVFVIAGAGLRKLPPAEQGLTATLLVLAVLLINFPMPPPHVIQRFDGAPWFRLVISHQFFGTVLLFGLCGWCVRRYSLTFNDESRDQGEAEGSAQLVG